MIVCCFSRMVVFLCFFFFFFNDTATTEIYTLSLHDALPISPTFSYTNDQRFHQSGSALLLPVPAGGVVPDTLSQFFDDRRTSINIGTPIRIGRWSWANNITISDVRSNNRAEFALPGDTVNNGIRRVLFGKTFETQVDWSTSINLPTLFTGTWKIQPGVAILNTTSGPFMLRNQFSGGQFVRQGKRLAFNVGASPAFFGFFPGFGPLSRIRHTISPIISYQYAPAVKIPDDYAHAFDPTGRLLKGRTDPQQTISLGLSQTFDAKLKPPAGDTAAEREPRKIKLLSISTSAISYNFERAKLPHSTGWQTGTLSNTFQSDLVPGLQFSMTHELWKGDVGSDTAKFSPRSE